MYNKITGVMTGTSGKADYTVVANQANGAIGVKELGGNSFRVRIETTSKLSGLSGFQEPSGGQQRYSTIVSGAIAVSIAVLQGLKALQNAAPVAAPAPAPKAMAVTF